MQGSRSLLCVVAMLAALAFCSSAAADVTVGEVAPATPEFLCNLGPTDVIQLGTSGGNSYVVPQAGTLTSWSTAAAPGAGQTLSLKVYRPLGGTVYSVIGEDGPRALVPSVLDTFPIDIPVAAGDVIGLNDGEAPLFNDACSFYTTPVGDVEGGLPGDAPTGSSLNFEAVDTMTEVRANVSANLVPTPPILVSSPPPAAGTPAPGPPSSGPPAAPAPQCLVPRLGAKKLRAAKKALKMADCRLGRVSRLKGATAKTGLVVSQSPQTGKKLVAGAKVAVKLAPPGA
jgi:PASTA domain